MRWLAWVPWLVWGLLFGIGVVLFLLKHALVVLSEALRMSLDHPPSVRTCLPLRQAPGMDEQDSLSRHKSEKPSTLSGDVPSQGTDAKAEP